jgi:hypothetical protein
MRFSRLIAPAAVVVLCACSVPGSTQPTPSRTGTATSSRTATSTAECPFTADTVTPTLSPLIEAQPPGSVSGHAITAIAHLTCGTTLTVADQGTADLRFGAAAVCQLVQYAGKVAKLVSRDPLNAFFRLGEGRIHCTLKPSQSHIPLCGMGTLLLTGVPTQVEGICQPEPVFQVAVLTGSVTVIDPAGVRHVLEAGQEISFNFSRRNSTTTSADLSTADMNVFDAQAQQMGLPVVQAPQTIKFTSTPPANAAPGDRYAVTADGGGSQEPVLFTIDTSSGKACTISGQIVTFRSAGTCAIDANQAGNAQFQAAPQQKQSVAVVVPPPA